MLSRVFPATPCLDLQVCKFVALKQVRRDYGARASVWVATFPAYIYELAAARRNLRYR